MDKMKPSLSPVRGWEVTVRGLTSVTYWEVTVRGLTSVTYWEGRRGVI